MLRNCGLGAREPREPLARRHPQKGSESFGHSSRTCLQKGARLVFARNEYGKPPPEGGPMTPSMVPGGAPWRAQSSCSRSLWGGNCLASSRCVVAPLGGFENDGTDCRSVAVSQGQDYWCTSPVVVSNITNVCWRACKSHPIIRIRPPSVRALLG